MSERIEHTTKPNGAGNTWLELGTWTTDAFGDARWQPADSRYPQHDRRLQVKREYDGRGKCQEIHWTILVPDGFPLTIRRRSGDGRPNFDRGEEDLYTP